jgi:hypothetical protein
MINILKNIFTAVALVALVVSIIVVGYVAGIFIAILLVFGIGYFLVSEYRKSKSDVVDEVKSE